MLWQLGHRKWAWKLLGEGKYTAPESQGWLALANTLMLEVGKDETHQAERKKPSHLPFPLPSLMLTRENPWLLAHLAEAIKLPIMRLPLMYCNWSQAPEIWSLGTKLTVDANRVSSPAMLHTMPCMGPGKLLIQSHPLLFSFPSPQPVSLS